jgi:FkbM family methyltransferase
MFSVLDLIADRIAPIAITDIGAMSLGNGKERYHGLLQRGAATVIGFEPVQSECDKLNQGAQPGCRYLPYAIGDGRAGILNITNTLMTSSLYEPDMALLAMFQTLDDFTRVVERAPMPTHRLDDVPEAANTDYLKIDVQGAELDVLNGATRVLEQAVVVETEVEFVPLYKNQPLFADVDAALRRNGFTLHNFANLASRTFKPVVYNNDANSLGSQLLWGDAVYIKDFRRLELLPRDKLVRLAVVLHDVYRSFDACAHVLQIRENMCGDGLLERYFQKLKGK